jgi:hypothetical protein
MEYLWNDTDRGKLKYSKKNLSHCYLSATNSTWTGLGSNPVLRSDRPAANRPKVLLFVDKFNEPYLIRENDQIAAIEAARNLN